MKGYLLRSKAYLKKEVCAIPRARNRRWPFPKALAYQGRAEIRRLGRDGRNKAAEEGSSRLRWEGCIMWAGLHYKRVPLRSATRRGAVGEARLQPSEAQPLQCAGRGRWGKAGRHGGKGGPSDR